MSNTRLYTLTLCLLSVIIFVFGSIPPGTGPDGDDDADTISGDTPGAGTRDVEESIEAGGGYWLDTFDGDDPQDGTEYLDGVRFLGTGPDSRVELWETNNDGYVLNGHFDTTVIPGSSANIDYWNTIRVQHALDTGEGHSFKVSVLDEAYNAISSEFTDVDMSTNKFLDISSIDTTVHKSITVRGKFHTENQWTTPRLYEWKVNWSMNQGPGTSHIEASADSVKRGDPVSLSVFGKDKEDDDIDLTVTMEAKPASGGVWSPEGFSNGTLLGDTWKGLQGWGLSFTPPLSYKTGLYDFRAALIDSRGKTGTWHEVQDLLEVKNNPPSNPHVVIDPYLPGTLDDLYLNITVESKDEEDSIDDISYEYVWKKDDIIQDIDGPTVTYDLTTKGQKWECHVTPYDSDGPGNTMVEFATIENTGALAEAAPSDFEIMEDEVDYSLDLEDIFEDPDGDTLYFSVLNTKHCTFTILENQRTIELVPDADWHGVERVLLAATDNASGAGGTQVPVNITVWSVNDPPDIVPIDGAAVDQDDWFNYTLQATDRDSSNVLYYYVDETTAPPGFTVDRTTGFMSYHATNDHVGSWNVTVRVEDDEFEPSNMSIWLDVINLNDPPTPPTIVGVNDTQTFFVKTVTTFNAGPATDPDSIHGQKLNYTWFIDGEVVGTTRSYNYKFEDVGILELTLMVDDGEHYANYTVNLTVAEHGGTGVTDTNKEKVLDEATIMGIIVAAVIGVAVIVIVALYLRHRHKKAQDEGRREYEDMQVEETRKAQLASAMYGAGGPPTPGGPDGPEGPGGPGPGAAPGGPPGMPVGGFGAVKCFQCGAQVPIPSPERPVVVTCSQCGTQGKISK